MKAFLAVAVPFPPTETAVCTFLELARKDRFGVHTITDNPDSADLILFVDPHQIPGDWRLRPIRRHPLAVKYRGKTMVYDERDQPWRALPGLYVSMPSPVFDTRRQRACAYHCVANAPLRVSDEVPDLLFSFMGGRTHKVRNAIFQLEHARAHIEDTSNINFFVDRGEPERAARLHTQKQRFAEMINRSMFVLCPRGAGTSSIRLYEVLAAGRVPVVISDDWVPPIGPDWNGCILRVREGDIAAIPALLEAAEPRYEEMAASAFRACQEWFAPDVIFHRMMESCQELLHSGEAFEPASSFNRQYIRFTAREAKAKARQFWRQLRTRLSEREKP